MNDWSKNKIALYTLAPTGAAGLAGPFVRRPAAEVSDNDNENAKVVTRERVRALNRTKYMKICSLAIDRCSVQVKEEVFTRARVTRVTVALLNGVDGAIVA